MIQRLRVIGYKSLKDVEIFFQPLSVILGPNAAGKSNLLDALSLVSRIVTCRNLKEAFDDHRGLPLESFYYGETGYERLLDRDTAEARFEVDVALSARTIEAVERLIAQKRTGMESEQQPKKRVTQRILRYGVTIQILPSTGHLRVLDESLRALKRNGQVKARAPFLEKISEAGKERLHLRMERQAHPMYYDAGLDHSIVSMSLYEPHYPHITALRRELSAWRFYYFEPRTLMREAVPGADVEAVGSRGENLAAFLNLIRAGGGPQMEAFDRTLRYLLPAIEHVEIQRTKEGLLSLRIIENGLPYSSRIISEGTLRVLGLLAALHPAAAATVIGYEEPENGVHPNRLKRVADLVKNTHKIHRKQVIVNTHSPIFPTYFDDQALFVCRKEGSTTHLLPFKATGPLFKQEAIARALDETVMAADEEP
jgi:predicted ATPase